MTTNPIRIKRIDHVVLRVRSLPDSIAFYRNVIGCAVERTVEELGLVQLRAGASLIDLVGVDTPLGRARGGGPEPSAPNLDHFALNLEAFEINAIRAHLSTFGIECGDPAPRYGSDGFGPSLYIQDPDGNTVELKGPPDEPDAASDPT